MLLHTRLFLYVNFYSLHVSGSHVPIIRRIIVSMRHLVYVTLCRCESGWLFTEMFILIDISCTMLSTLPRLLHMLARRKNRKQTYEHYSSNTENNEFSYLAVSCSGEEFSRTITGLHSLSLNSLPGDSAETFCCCCVCLCSPAAFY